MLHRGIIFGKYSIIRVKHNKDNCTKCNKCIFICPEPQVLDLIGKRSGSINKIDCMKCARCIEVCNDNALKYGFLILKILGVKNEIYNKYISFYMIFIGCASENGNRMSLDETALGLRSASLYSENINLKEFTYSTTPAGESIVIERAYENAPPMNATPVPLSHTYDTFKDEQTNAIVDIRYNCNLCHTPQANVKPIVGNNFKPDFRDQNSKNRSNLLEILDEGVK